MTVKLIAVPPEVLPLDAPYFCSKACVSLFTCSVSLLESVCSREAVFLSTSERICGRNFSFK